MYREAKELKARKDTFIQREKERLYQQEMEEATFHPQINKNTAYYNSNGL
jgi:hypothetical protein